MKRSSPPRRTRLARGAPPKRSTKPIRARKADPTKRRFAKHRCQPYLDWLHTQPCCVTGRRTGQWYAPGEQFIQVDPAHLKARGPGHDDLYNCVPLARHLHEEQRSWNCGMTTWRTRHPEVDLEAIAREHTDRWLATDEGLAWTREHSQ